jgi:hypothetical protein
MMHKRRLLTATVFALLLTVFVTTSAFAHYCTNANKKDGAGSVGIYNVVTETFEPSKQFINEAHPNGGFVTLTDGATFWYDVYLHQTLPVGALAAGPGGDDQCDGLGVDNFLVCIGAVAQ